jgi:hypothetical protein
MRIYCDSVILIYYFEGVPPFKARATNRLAALWAAGDVMLVSDLVRLECRMQPVRLGDAILLAAYDNLFSQPNTQRVSITTAVFDRDHDPSYLQLQTGRFASFGGCRGVRLRLLPDERYSLVGFQRYPR